jgi:hypothetical protein
MPQIQQMDNNPQQVMDYGEILRNINDDSQQMQQQMPQQMPQQMQQQMPQQMQQQMPQQMQHGQFIPPPVVQSMKPQGYVMQPIQEPTAQQPVNNISETQKDVFIILILCVIFYNEHFQSLLSRILPALFKNDRLSSVGSIAIASLVAGGLYLSKSISFKIV